MATTNRSPEDRSYREERIVPSSGSVKQWTFEAFNREATGPCAHCGHTTKSQVPYEVQSQGSDDDPHTTLAIRIDCACGLEHFDGNGANRKNCGRYWYLTKHQSANPDWFTVAPPDEAVERAADAARQSPALAAVKAAAEKWTTGVTAILGLFGISGFVVAKDTISVLNAWAKVSILSLIAVATSLAVLSILNSWKAAYGLPEISRIQNTTQLQQWFARRDNAQESINALHLGIRYSISALIALLLATALILLWPKDDTVGPLVDVTTVDGSKACGEVLASTNSNELRVRRADGSVANVRGDSLAGVKPTQKCT